MTTVQQQVGVAICPSAMILFLVTFVFTMSLYLFSAEIFEGYNSPVLGATPDDEDGGDGHGGDGDGNAAVSITPLLTPLLLLLVVVLVVMV